MNHDSRSFEDELSSVRADVAVMRSNYATKEDLQAVRIELKAEIQDARTELKAEIQDARTELKAEIQDARIELKAEIQDVRLEIKDIAAHFLSRLDEVKMELMDDIGALRIDSEKLRGEMHAVRAEVQRSLNVQTWRIIGAISSLVVAVYFIVHAGY